MSVLEVVQDLMLGLDTGNFNKVSSLLSDDFKLSLPAPFPIGKMEVMAFLGVFKNAFPDWSYNFTEAREEGNKVKGNLKPHGTHINDVFLPGMPPIKATGKVISFPVIPVEIIVNENKVSELKIDQIPGGSISTLMENLGINLPGM